MPAGYTLPIGGERISKGYVMVKVREKPSRPGGRDNWKYKHVLVWEEANGPLPDGHVLLFADRDTTNCSLDNLLLVPKTLVGALNEAQTRDITWHDMESLKACVAHAELERAIVDASSMGVCVLCGATFTARSKRNRVRKVCPDCIKLGRRARREPGSLGDKGEGTCKRCGATFQKDRKDQVNCPACIALHRKRSSREKCLGEFRDRERGLA